MFLQWNSSLKTPFENQAKVLLKGGGVGLGGGQGFNCMATLRGDMVLQIDFFSLSNQDFAFMVI